MVLCGYAGGDRPVCEYLWQKGGEGELISGALRKDESANQPSREILCMRPRETESAGTERDIVCMCVEIPESTTRARYSSSIISYRAQMINLCL